MTHKQNDELSGLTTVGIDLSKDVFHSVGFDAGGAMIVRNKIGHLNTVRD